MRGTWQTTGGGFSEGVGTFAALAAAVALVWWLLTIIWILAAIVGVMIAGVVVTAVLMRRKYARVPQVLPWDTRAALPPPDAPPLSGRPAQALSGPREFHVHLHGVTRAEAAEEIAALRDAGYRAYGEGRTP